MASLSDVIADGENLALRVEQKSKVHLIDDALTRPGNLCQPRCDLRDGFGRLLRPLTVFHPEWVGNRIETLTGALARFRDQPSALAGCFGGALLVQVTMVVFYFAVAEALGKPFVDVYLSVKELEYAEFMKVISPWEREHLLLHV